MTESPAPAWGGAFVPLSVGNFTPVSRTPWGGEVIGRRYKDAVVPAAVGQRIGESWEFSCDPAFPSRIAGGPWAGRTLAELVAALPEAVLSPAQAGAAARGLRGDAASAAGPRRGCEILVKLLDAAEPLSVQVHPTDGDPALASGECGKPESWLVLAAEPGSGIYLGFTRRLGRAELRAALQDGDRAKALLHFEPVAVGDYFEIEPGVPHAIGPGVTLLEPQRVLPGLAGKTYRLWDWGRRYAADGRPDPAHGAPRALHLDEGLRLVDPEHQVGPGFAGSLRRAPRRRVAAGGALELQEFPANSYYQVHLGSLRFGATFTLNVLNGYGALTVLAGELQDATSAARLPKGQTALLPHAALPVTLTAAAGTLYTLVVPAGATVEV